MTTRINGHEYIEVPCIQVTQPVGTFYIASINYNDLLDISYADVRRLESNSTELETYIGIQRLLSPSRVKEIANYVQLVDATFPTGIIVEINEFASQTNENGEEEVVTYLSEGEEKQLENVIYNSERHVLQIRKNENVAKVLDGQHRLAGLRQGALDQIDGKKFELNVTIFVDMDIEDQAIVFATINKSHTKVNKSLVADLFEYTKTRSPQKTAHNIARALNQKEGSPFFGKINILGQAQDEGETITQATFVDGLLKYISGNNLRAMRDRDLYKRGNKPEKVSGLDEQKLFFRNLFIDERDAEIAQILWNYFSAVKEKWPTAWSDPQRGFVLNRSTGFIALMKFLRPAYLSLNKKGGVATKDEFSTIFAPVTITDNQFTRETYLPGTAGQSLLYRHLLEQTGLS
jgi:DGQHR domain-containing protein